MGLRKEKEAKEEIWILFSAQKLGGKVFSSFVRNYFHSLSRPALGKKTMRMLKLKKDYLRNERFKTIGLLDACGLLLLLFLIIILPTQRTSDERL